MRVNHRYFVFTPLATSLEPTILFMPFGGRVGDQIQVTAVGNGDFQAAGGTGLRIKLQPVIPPSAGGSGRSAFIYTGGSTPGTTQPSSLTTGFIQDINDQFPSITLECISASRGFKDSISSHPALWSVIAQVATAPNWQTG
jgi:hypothetical protein